ncbi:MAG: phosphate ABC transporter permease subunit PstC [Candidatus Bipolaricaulota bacterium]|nr:phosphate ABC transporter permease subunit PstC [Candidatus Bipolaricaulota bacterium]
MAAPPRSLPRAARGRSRRERLATWGLTLAGLLAVAITLTIIALFIQGSLPFLRTVPLREFLGGIRWAPIHEPASYGILPLIGATLVTTGIALIVAVPLGLLSAVFLSAYAPSSVRRVLKPALELLAGVPTVVYGFFALRFVTPLLQGFIPDLGFWNGLSAGLVMGIMIIPYMASLSEDVLYAVPRSLWEGAYAVGATRFEAVTRVVIPAALSGIGAAFILALTRAVGETMIVALAAGRTPTWPPDPRQPLLTLTTAIVNIATGDHEATAFIWSAVFAIGLLLFLVTLVLNTVSYLVIQRFRERYA